MFIYRKTFVYKPISNQLNILVVCNLSFSKSLNTSYLLLWMDNLMQIEHQQRFLNLFSISNHTCCKFVASKETIVSHPFQSYCSNQTKHTSQGALYGGTRVYN